MFSIIWLLLTGFIALLLIFNNLKGKKRDTNFIFLVILGYTIMLCAYFGYVSLGITLLTLLIIVWLSDRKS